MLVGNGLSIAFNPELNLRTITQEMIDRISSEGEDGDDVVAAMREIAARALPDGANTDDDFEVLVGAFGAESRTLSYLQELADLVSPQDENLRDAIKLVSAFAERVRDTGLSHVLQVIFERSHAYESESEPLRAFVRGILGGFAGQVAIANLNYDTLLLAALLNECDRDELADMASGYKRVTVHSEGETIRRVPALREVAADFPADRRVRLLHLHGSVTYWSDREKDVFAKLDTSFLRNYDQWEAVRQQDTDVRPVVVLANQRDKATTVTEYPFSLAYEMFKRGLARADKWLIVGYSFRDDPINAALRDEFIGRVEKPSVLVVTHGSYPTRREIRRAFGWGAEDGKAHWLTVNREGAFDLMASDEWEAFTP